MKKASSKKLICVAVIESARLPFSALDSQIGHGPGIEVISCNLAELGSRKDIDVVLLNTSLSKDLFGLLAGLGVPHRHIRFVVDRERYGRYNDSETSRLWRRRLSGRDGVGKGISQSCPRCIFRIVLCAEA